MYILFTNIWNERDRIEHMFQMVNGFSLKPELWVWIDDGSNDGSRLEIERCIPEHNLNVVVVSLCPKNQGDLRTIGNAYNYAFELLNLKRLDFDFMCIMDVDNTFHPRYLEEVSYIFTMRPDLGVISGHHTLDTELKMPRGNGKCVRWEIIRNIDEFWDISPDTFINIKAKAQGYDWCILIDEIGEFKGPQSGFVCTAAGAHNGGWQWYYASGSWIGAIKRTVYRMFKRRHGISYLKGFLQNAKKDKRQCQDVDVREFYGGK